MTIQTDFPAPTPNIASHKSLKSPNSLQPVFIVGTPKSGTTFLLSLFDSHPNAITLLETAAYHVPMRGMVGHSQRVSILNQFYSSLMQEHSIHAKITPDVFRRTIETMTIALDRQALPKALIYGFVSMVLDGLGSLADQTTHFIEKTPRHYDSVDRILADFPQAKIIHVLRDPRDNYLALKRMMDEPGYQGIGYHPTSFLQDRLLASLESAYTNVQKYGQQYRLVFYEDLILGGEPVIRDLVSWLGLPWSDVLLVPSYNGELWCGNSLASDLKDRLKPFDRRPIGRWKEALTEQERDVVEWIIEAYRLTNRYSLSRARSMRRRVLSLLLPFSRELRMRKAPWDPKTMVLRFKEAIVWNYATRRIWIAARLWERLRNGDDRLAVPSSLNAQ